MRHPMFKIIGLLAAAGVIWWRMEGRPLPDFLESDDSGFTITLGTPADPQQNGAGPQDLDQVAALLARVAEGASGAGSAPTIQSVQPLIDCLEQSGGNPDACQSVAAETIAAQPGTQPPTVTVNRGGNGGGHGGDAGGVRVFRPHN